VHLECADVSGEHVRAAQSCDYQSLLRQTVWRRERARTAILVNPAPSKQGGWIYTHNFIAEHGHVADEHHATALAFAIPVRGRVEGFAPSVRRRHARRSNACI
jgi:hypothetical protein